ncbi:hypothetical protein HMPREF3156_00446, partial [Neisseria sp. HMSC06F02]
PDLNLIHYIYAGSGFILKPSRYVKFLKRTDFPQEKLEGK